MEAELPPGPEEPNSVHGVGDATAPSLSGARHCMELGPPELLRKNGRERKASP